MAGKCIRRMLVAQWGGMPAEEANAVNARKAISREAFKLNKRNVAGANDY